MIIFSFAEESVVFQCRYSRAVNVEQEMTVGSNQQPEVGRGDLNYSMSTTVGSLGGTTEVRIEPNHSFGDEVGARLVIFLKLSLNHLISLTTS